MKEIQQMADTLQDEHLKSALLDSINQTKSKTTAKSPATKLKPVAHICDKIITNLANKTEEQWQSHTNNTLTYDDPKQEIIRIWLDVCQKNTNATGEQLVAALKETAYFELYTKICHKNKTNSFNQQTLQHDLYELNIINIHNKIQKLLHSEQQALSANEKAIIQALIKEKKQWQTAKAELALCNQQ